MSKAVTLINIKQINQVLCVVLHSADELFMFNLLISSEGHADQPVVNEPVQGNPPERRHQHHRQELAGQRCQSIPFNPAQTEQPPCHSVKCHRRGFKSLGVTDLLKGS